jgi:pyruvate,water dikinase
VSKRWVLWFEELGQEHNDLVGKKCANLGEMTKMGLRVPPGFALSVEAYRDFMSMIGAVDEIKEYLAKWSIAPKDLKQFNQLSADIRQLVQSKVMPKEMEETIVSYYTELCHRSNTAEVAVSTRSAGTVSRPGQYETYLNVIGNSDLLDKIKKVWASTFNPRSLAFRNRQGIPLESDPIGVAVLKMVNARAAGVVFTADPNTGDTTRMIIEANWGLGESVVSGEATPDTYILDKESLEIQERKLGAKSRYVTFKEVGVAEEEIPPEKSGKLCLSDEEAKEIGKLGRILENHFGVPQDAEWAIDQDLPFPENIIMLQTRAEVIAQKKTPTDQIMDLMLKRL